jgi:hypothetical protein
MKILFAAVLLGLLFGFFGVFFRGRLSGCAGSSCAKRQAGSCGCPPEESDSSAEEQATPSQAD